MTTRPPLSPVARRSPSWLNSTHEIISAVIKNIILIFINNFVQNITKLAKNFKIITY